MAHRRINISQEIKDFATVYSSVSAAMRKNGAPQQVSAIDVAKQAARSSLGLGGLPAVQPDPVSPSGGAGGAGGTPNAGGAGAFSDTHKAVMDMLTSRGVKPEVAAGAVGSMLGESGKGLDPTAYNPDDNGSPSGGIAQWHKDRFDNLVAGSGLKPEQIAPNNKFAVPLDQQLKFLGHELDTSENSTLKQLQQASTLDQGNSIWTKSFERPADPAGQAAARLPKAQQFWQWAQGQQPVPTRDAGTPPSASTMAQALPTDNAPVPPQRPADLSQATPAQTPTQQTAASDASTSDASGDDEAASVDVAAADPVDGFAGGGIVGQRPDRVANPIPGLSALPPDKGTGPGGGFTAKRALSPGYADGGSVDEAALEDEHDAGPGEGPGEGQAGEADAQQQAMPTANPAPVSQSQPITSEGNTHSGVLDGIGDALDGALGFISEAFGFGGAQAAPARALPPQHNPAIMEGLHRLFSGEDAASSSEYNTVLNTVDPDKALDNGLRQAAGLNAAYHYYLERGEAPKAKAVAASLVMHMQGLSQQFGDRAVKYMQQGKTPEAIKELQQGYEMIPDGNSVDAQAHADGSATVTQKGPDGSVVKQFRASPQQLLAAAVGLKHGTGYYQMLAEAAGMAKQQKQKVQEPPSSAFQQWQQGALPSPSASGAVAPQHAQAPAPAQTPAPAPAQTPPPQALPSAAPTQAPPPPAGVTPQGNAPAPQATQTAIPDMPQLQLPPPPPPPDMNLLRQMKPEEQRQVIAHHQAELRDWRANVSELRAEHAARANAITAQRTEVFRQNQENLRQARALQSQHNSEQAKVNAPFSIGERHAMDQDIAGAMDGFKQSLGEGQSLSANDERSLRTAAFHVAANRHNALSADEAVDAAVDLADPTNKALDDAKPGDGGLTSVKLRNGTTLQLDDQAIGAIQKIRQSKSDALKQQDYDKKHAFGPRAARALGTMAEGGAGVLGEASRAVARAVTPRNPLTPSGELMKSLWGAYKQSTGQ